jgi:hypothetical protein
MIFNREWWRVWRNERLIRQKLRELSRQRVSSTLDSGVVIEKAVPVDAEAVTAFLTCHMRGWVEPADTVLVHPVEVAYMDGSIDVKPHTIPGLPAGYPRAWRLTDSGWQVLHRTQPLVLLSFAISALSLIVALFALAA